MPHVETISDFRVPATLSSAYERMIEGLKSGGLGAAVRDAIDHHTGGAKRLYLYEARGDDDSRLRFHSCEPGMNALFPLYLRYRRLDPVCQAYRAAPHQGDIVMQRVRPLDIACSDFRQRFFDQAGIVERLSIVQRGAGEWRAMNVARHRDKGHFSDTEVGNIVGIASLALPLLTLDDASSEKMQALGIDRLEERFASLCPALSRREREVCARAAKGMSVEATALHLEIGKASVHTYRQRAYRRLGISSPIELSALISH